MSKSLADENIEAIAIIGMSCRFPGANNIEQFWQNLRDGVESITFFTDGELIKEGVEASALNDPGYVKASAVLEDADLFDASFFGFSPREAEITDPQHRLFLECAWEALENAGCDTENFKGSVGVYAGAGLGTYLLKLYSASNLVSAVGSFKTMIGNDRDYLPSLISYKLNLKGPSINVQTACSTSLVAVHLACQSLLNYQSDVALAGGVTINVPQKTGYLYQEGGINSPDGHCRAFDAKAQGTIGGNGVGIVVLKRLEDAVADGDYIWAVIRGSAVNNDGAAKIGYTAPSVDGQAEVIAAAQALSGVEPETITYVETHGSGTPLGDPIEIAALTKAFRSQTSKKGFCAIGSVKTNLGHLGAAAGVAGLIKTTLALKHKLIPPSLHYQQPNPRINFVDSPFYVNSALSEWKVEQSPRRAGVSSFGIGGTNAHAIVEEWLPSETSGESRAWQLLVLSAKTESALETATDNLADYFRHHPDANLADAAYTCQVGRRAFKHRRALVCRSIEDASNALIMRDPRRILTGAHDGSQKSVAFMFPGLGDHYVDMARGLYQAEPIFRREIDRCSEILAHILGADIRDVIYPNEVDERAGSSHAGGGSAGAQAGLDFRKMLSGRTGKQDPAAARLNQTHLTQPAVFVIEYALARLWMQWGVHPQFMIGYSIGEYMAAHLAGVFSLEDALMLVARRAQMIQELEGGAMLAVSLPEESVLPMLCDELSLAAVNSPSLCVISGSLEAIASMERALAEKEVVTRRLQTSHAFHSKLMEPLRERLTEMVSGFKLSQPRIPYLSNVTGEWIKASEAIDPSYWSEHMCRAVRFADGISHLWKQANCILLEVGPGQMLTSLAIQQLEGDDVSERVALPSMRSTYEQRSDTEFILNTLGQIWLAGGKINWDSFHAEHRRQRLPLPTYPFERSRFWIDEGKNEPSRAEHEQQTVKEPIASYQLYAPSWRRTLLARQLFLTGSPDEKACRIVFVDQCGVGRQLIEALQRENQNPVAVTQGEEFARLGDYSYSINPARNHDYDLLIESIVACGMVPRVIVHLWNVTVDDRSRPEVKVFDEPLQSGFYSLLFIAQTLAKRSVAEEIKLAVVSNNLYDVAGNELSSPEKSTLLGLCKVIPQEYPVIKCKSIDIVLPNSNGWQAENLTAQLLSETTTESPDRVVAFRGNQRWVQTFDPIRPSDKAAGAGVLRQGGAYLMAGELTGATLLLAEYLATNARAALVLLTPSTLPVERLQQECPDERNASDRLSIAIKHIKSMEESGAHFVVIQGDAANEDELRAAAGEAHRLFGSIDGLIYAPGSDDGRIFKPLSEISSDDCENYLKKTYNALCNIEKISQRTNPDFCLLMTSLSSVLGGPESTLYSAANILADTFAQARGKLTAMPWMSLNWDSALSPEKAAAVFNRVFSLGYVERVVISASDLMAKIERWINLEPLQSAHEQGGTTSHSMLHSRPNVKNAYVPPGNQTEQMIAEVWQELLGIERIGAHDNFFQLGGDSMMGIRLTARLRKTYEVDLPVRILLEAPTVAGMALVIEEILLTEIEGLDEDEAPRLLS